MSLHLFHLRDKNLEENSDVNILKKEYILGYKGKNSVSRWTQGPRDVVPSCPVMWAC